MKASLLLGALYVCIGTIIVPTGTANAALINVTVTGILNSGESVIGVLGSNVNLSGKTITGTYTLDSEAAWANSSTGTPFYWEWFSGHSTPTTFTIDGVTIAVTGTDLAYAQLEEDQFGNYDYLNLFTRDRETAGYNGATTDYQAYLSIELKDYGDDLFAPYTLNQSFSWPDNENPSATDLTTGSNSSAFSLQDCGSLYDVNTCTHYAYGNFSLTQLSWEVQPVPITPAFYLFGSGLLGLIGISKRQKVV